MDIQDIFGEPISVYTEEQAIEDGVLHHLWPERWPWLLVTETLYAEACGVADDRNVKWGQVLVPLVMDAIMETQRQMRLNPRCDLVTLEHTAVGTVWIRPNGKGGMTIMKPEDVGLSVTETPYLSKTKEANMIDILKEYAQGKRDFRNVNLQWANLHEADLHEADLQGANLQGANLQGANLQGANLQGANLQGANLRRADLQLADLQWANLQWANLRRANLHRANLYGANLRRANLRRADLQRADLRRAHLLETNTLVIYGLRWTVIKYPTDMQIGCKRHTYEEWSSFTDDEISKMDNGALQFWKENKDLLLFHPPNGRDEKSTPD